MDTGFYIVTCFDPFASIANRKKREIVSHGVGDKSGQHVGLPCETLDVFCAMNDKYIHQKDGQLFYRYPDVFDTIKGDV